MDLSKLVPWSGRAFAGTHRGRRLLVWGPLPGIGGWFGWNGLDGNRKHWKEADVQLDRLEWRLSLKGDVSFRQGYMALSFGVSSLKTIPTRREGASRLCLLRLWPNAKYISIHPAAASMVSRAAVRNAIGPPTAAPDRTISPFPYNEDCAHASFHSDRRCSGFDGMHPACAGTNIFPDL
jgi:hypothetical protein